MKKISTGTNLLSKILFSAIVLALAGNLQAQLQSTSNPKLSEFTLYSGDVGKGITLIGSSITINKGAVGANKTVQTTGNATINADILSGNNVILTNSNVVKGNIYARGSLNTVISVGSSLTLTGNINSNGNVNIGGGSITGSVNILPPGTYSGPTPSIMPIGNQPLLPSLPSMPGATSLSSYPAAITTSQTASFTAQPITAGQLTWGNYGNINFSGNKTLTLNGPGIYIFNSMVMTGNSNKIVFDFGTNPSGKFYVYVRNNADLGKLNTSTLNGPLTPASNIYMEIQGNGIGTSVSNSSFIIANGSGGGSKMLGTIYTPNAEISIGSGTGSTSLAGALYSRYAISIQSGVTLDHAPFDFCIPPTVGAASSTPTLCISTPLTNITHTTTGATGISNSGVSGANGLPAGVSATWVSNIITISGTPTASGTFNYSIPVTGSCGTVNATGTITVTPNNTAGAASSTPTLCINTPLTNITHTTTGATGIGSATGLPAGVTASWASNTITISGTPTASGTFNYSIPLTGGCGSVNATGTIIVNNLPTAPSVSSPVSYCLNETSIQLSATGTGLLWYSSATGGSGSSTAPTPSTAIAGTTSYWVSQTNANNCEGPRAKIDVVVNALPTASISYAGSPFCAIGTGSVTQTGQTGGTYSSTLGLNINSVTGAIDLAASTPGTYTVTYSFTDGTCYNTTSTSVTINALPTANISYAGSPFCATGTGTVTRTGQAGGNYSSTAGLDINSANGNINLVTSTPGTYIVTYSFSNGNNCQNTATTSVTINANPTVNAGTDKVLKFIAATNLEGITSALNPQYEWTTNNGVITSSINQAAITVSSAGTYSLKVTETSTGCSGSGQVKVTSRLSTIKGSELQSIYENYNPATFDPENDTSFFKFNSVGETDYVTIDIIFKKVTGEDVADTRARITSMLIDPYYGLIPASILPNGLSPYTITGDFPILNLPKLDALIDELNYCRPYYRPFTNSGIVTSQGDITMRSNLVRSGYELTGAGVKIGVISDSYRKNNDVLFSSNPPGYINTNTETTDVSLGDLPALDPDHLTDFPIKRTDEGRAMMQIVHDVAPGAEKFFRTGVFTAGDFAAGIKELAAKGCKVIVDDVTYPTEPFMKDGVVAKAVNDVRDNGVLYFTAAGNFAKNSYESEHYLGLNNPGNRGITSPDFPDVKVHDFGAGDIYQKVKLKPGNYMFVFQWVDDIYSINETAGTHWDMDLYLTKTTDGKGLIGFNRDNTGGDPIEFIPITIPEVDLTNPNHEYNIVIVNNTGGAGPARLKYVVFKNDIEFLEPLLTGQNASTILGQGNAAGAITVGAARFNHVPGHPLLPAAYASITKPRIEDFSSKGGTSVVDIDGNLTLRLKPDLVGPDGVNTTVKMGPDYPSAALDGWSNFFGTSAAAPHAAAAAALLLQGKEKFLLENIQNITPENIKVLMQKTAVDMRPDNNTYDFEGAPNPATYDFLSGAGLVDVDAAMRTFANPKPHQIRLDKPVDENIIPCQDPFTLKIVGENFSQNSVVRLYDAAGVLTNTITYIDPVPASGNAILGITDNSILVRISTCVGNPMIKVYTEGKTTNGDGGESNGIRLFERGIIVTTQNVSKKYGQNNPTQVPVVVTFDNGDQITDATSPSLTDVGLDAAKLNIIETDAALYSSIGTYPIKVKREFDNTDLADKALTNKYSYIFNNGLITIEKMPLKVTPNDLTATYGNHLGNITYKYEFLQDQPFSATALQDTAKKYHDAYLPGNALAVVKDFKTSLTENDLYKEFAGNPNANTYMSTMVTFNALKNSRKFKIEGGKLVPETNVNAINSQYIVDIASESISAFKTDPSKAQFYEGSAGIHKKALLGEIPLNEFDGSIVDGSNTVLATMIRGDNTPVLNGSGGIDRLAPIINGNLVTLLDGEFATLNGNGDLVPTPGSPKIQYLNNSTGIGSLFYLDENGAVHFVTDDNTYVKIPNSAPGLQGFQVINNGGLTLKVLINGGNLGTSLEPLINVSDIVLSTDGTETLLNGALTLKPLVNGSIVALNGGLGLSILINGALTLKPLVNGALTLKPLVNGALTLKPLVNGALTLKPLVNGALTLKPLVNSGGSGGYEITNNNAVIVDEADVNELNSNYLGGMFSISMITGLDAGTQAIVAGTLPNPNFDITYGIGHANIVPVQLTPHITANDKPYDGKTDATLSSQTVTGMVNGDVDVTLIVGDKSFNNPNAGTRTVTASSLTLGGTKAGNYVLAPGATATYDAEITPIPLTAATTVDPKVYNGSAATGIVNLGTVTGYVGNETLTITTTASNYANANVGNGKATTISYGLADGKNGGLAANYSMANLLTSGDITAKALTATSTVAPKVYDGSAVTGSVSLGTVTGLVVGETLVITPTASNYADANVGNGKTTTISYGLANGTGLASNYSMADLPTSGNITAKALTAATTVAPKVYDGLAVTGVVNLGTVTGLVSGETLTITPTASNYANANVGNDKATSISYGLANGTGLAANYSMANLATTGSITAKALTATSTVAPKVYNGNSVTGTVTLGIVTGLVVGETLAITPTASNYSDANVGTGKATTISYGLASGTGLASNYSMANLATTGAITAKALTATSTVAPKVYDGSPVTGTVSLGTVTGLVGSETLVITPTASNYANANVGNGKTTTISYSLASGTGLASNYSMANLATTGNITAKPITVTPNSGQNKIEGDSDPALLYTNTPLVGNDQFSGALTRDAGENVGLYNITQGNLSLGNNYSISFITGVKFEIKANTCLITRSATKNFNSTTAVPTSLWVNFTVKVSGQLNANGDYLLFKTGSITFNNISSSVGSNPQAIPNGKVIADNTVSAPVTNFDVANNMWITKIPVGFASTSDIFLTAVIVPSATGFVKNNNNANTVVKGALYSTKTYKDQWTYAIAAYQPPFTYTDVDGAGEVVAINAGYLNYRAGTPVTQIANVVSGGSGNGGTNYTGATYSFDNFTACPITSGSLITGRSGNLSTSVVSETITNASAGEVQVFPNPASDFITLTYVPTSTGNSKIIVYSIDGRKVFEADNGISEAGVKYQKKIDVNKLIRGVYLVQLLTADNMTVKKIVINR